MDRYLSWGTQIGDVAVYYLQQQDLCEGYETFFPLTLKQTLCCSAWQRSERPPTASRVACACCYWSRACARCLRARWTSSTSMSSSASSSRPANPCQACARGNCSSTSPVSGTYFIINSTTVLCCLHSSKTSFLMTFTRSLDLLNIYFKILYFQK